MREIKFRAWDTETKEMSYDFLDRNWLKVCTGSPYVELMQYTGLKDKNGKEIYEGDIVKGETDILFQFTGQVNYAGIRYVVDGIGKYKNVREELNNAYEIIGNVYELELAQSAIEPNE